MRRFFTFLAFLIFFAGLSGGLYYLQFIFKPEFLRGIISKNAPPPATVAVEAARSESWQPRLPAIGTFKAVAGIDIAPQAGGLVKGVHIESGKDIAKGAPVVEIDDSTEQADLKSSLANLKNTELTLDRQKQLISSGNGTQVNLDSALAARDQSAATAEKTRAIIAQKAITAPFAGRLGLRKVDPGQYVSPGTALVTLTQLDPIFADFPVAEQALDKVKTGLAVEIKVDAFKGKVFSGKIVSIDARVNAETRNVTVRAQIANADLSLLPGMFANVDVLAGDPVNVTTLPRTGVTFSLYGDSIYVVKPAPPPAGEAQAAPSAPQADAPLVVERRFVRSGDARGDRVAILDGLAVGERVVTQGQIKLFPNARVKVDETATLAAPAALPKP